LLKRRLRPSFFALAASFARKKVAIAKLCHTNPILESRHLFEFANTIDKFTT
jgi:hypothetical protein